MDILIKQQTRTRRRANNAGNLPGPGPIAPRDKISRSGEPLTHPFGSPMGELCHGMRQRAMVPDSPGILEKTSDTEEASARARGAGRRARQPGQGGAGKGDTQACSGNLLADRARCPCSSTSPKGTSSSPVGPPKASSPSASKVAARADCAATESKDHQR